MSGYRRLLGISMAWNSISMACNSIPMARNSISMACNGMASNFLKFEKKKLSARSQKNGKIGHNSDENGLYLDICTKK